MAPGLRKLPGNWISGFIMATMVFKYSNLSISTGKDTGQNTAKANLNCFYFKSKYFTGPIHSMESYLPVSDWKCFDQKVRNQFNLGTNFLVPWIPNYYWNSFILDMQLFVELFNLQKSIQVNWIYGTAKRLNVVLLTFNLLKPAW